MVLLKPYTSLIFFFLSDFWGSMVIPRISLRFHPVAVLLIANICVGLVMVRNNKITLAKKLLSISLSTGLIDRFRLRDVFSRLFLWKRKEWAESSHKLYASIIEQCNIFPYTGIFRLQKRVFLISKYILS